MDQHAEEGAGDQVGVPLAEMGVGFGVAQAWEPGLSGACNGMEGPAVF